MQTDEQKLAKAIRAVWKFRILIPAAPSYQSAVLRLARTIADGFGIGLAPKDNAKAVHESEQVAAALLRTNESGPPPDHEQFERARGHGATALREALEARRPKRRCICGHGVMDHANTDPMPCLKCDECEDFEWADAKVLEVQETIRGVAAHLRGGVPEGDEVHLARLLIWAADRLDE